MLGWLAALAVVIGCTVYIVRDRRERQRQRNLVMYMRQSDLYAHLYPMVRKLDNMHVESVAVRREEVRVRTYQPAGRVIRFTFDKHGFDPLEDAALYALAQAIGVDSPILRDKNRYQFIAHEAFGSFRAIWLYAFGCAFCVCKTSPLRGSKRRRVHARLTHPDGSSASALRSPLPGQSSLRHLE